jgi:hypothetical protein
VVGFRSFFERRAEHEPVGGQIILFGDIGEQIVADIELRMNVQVHEAGANDFSRGVDHTIRLLGFVRAYRLDLVVLDDYRTVRNNFMSGTRPPHHHTAVDTNPHETSFADFK